MPFVVKVAADLYGKKFNKAFTFPICPSMQELVNAVESRYDVCARAHRPAGYVDVPFKAHAFQQFDAERAAWVDVASATHLKDMAQLFAFQPESLWHHEVAGAIPNPTHGPTWLYTDRVEARRPGDSGPPPTQKDKLRCVFHRLDCGNKGYCQYTDVREGLARCGVDFTDVSSAEVFRTADGNGDGHVTYDEWVKFALDHPEVVDALYFRMKDASPDGLPADGWFSGTQVPALKPSASQREAHLAALRADAATARDRVQLLKDAELAHREAEAARQLSARADSHAAARYQTYLRSDVLNLQPLPRLPA
eukprot:TRINITY_DN19520_c0_g1_i1.p1 TRINITY_DN19520_c0_g1~~TRINITY_DN19520_c0_g1_i1.p1  ORF type:complete len:308 (+),score=118.55 TRINITY_DN19520_c0_g1_i1:106-1029(+)